MSRPAVFLDRDGTMIEEVGYLSRWDAFQWYPWTIDAVRLLNRAGFLVCVVTNQGGIGLGLFSEAFVHDVHRAMEKDLDAAGAKVDGWFYCPHHPRATIDARRIDCDCRKPRPGLVLQAAQQFDIDLSRSFVVGDKVTDLGVATAVGARAVLVRSGHGEEALSRYAGAMPDGAHVATELMAATAWMLGQSGFPEARA